jgi:hypothetical protein
MKKEEASAQECLTSPENLMPANDGPNLRSQALGEEQLLMPAHLPMPDLSRRRPITMRMPPSSYLAADCYH